MQVDRRRDGKMAGAVLPSLLSDCCIPPHGLPVLLRGFVGKYRSIQTERHGCAFGVWVSVDCPPTVHIPCALIDRLPALIDIKYISHRDPFGTTKRALNEERSEGRKHHIGNRKAHIVKNTA